MIDELKPYPEYKSTEVPWVGDVPAHWKMDRAKWLYKKMARPVQDSDEIVTCFRDGIVTLRKNRRLDGFTNSLKEIGYQGVRRGDLVIHAMDAFAGAVGVSDSDGKSTPVYSVCTARRELDNRYYAYLVREMARSQWILCLARGIRERSTDFRFQSFGEQTVPLPPLEEQRVIANYLDANAAKIRRFIRNRRRLIEVLNEQKQAIINRAVTRGLDPNAPLKPSGIDWLGDIPEHWKVLRLRNIAELRVSNVDKHTKAGEYPVRLCNYTDVYKNKVITADMPFMAATATRDEVKAFRLHVGDVIITKDSEDWQDIGMPAFVAETAVDLVCGYHLAILRPRPNIAVGRFLSYALQCKGVVAQLSLAAKGVTRYGLSHGAIKTISLPAPPLEEQEPIVQNIDEATASLEEAIARATREIDLIREYRTRLIADVVTGKVDVRHLAPPPGSEDSGKIVEELEPLDGAAGELNEDTLAGEVEE